VPRNCDAEKKSAERRIAKEIAHQQVFAHRHVAMSQAINLIGKSPTNRQPRMNKSQITQKRANNRE
jgi:hypothetical protein